MAADHRPNHFRIPCGEGEPPSLAVLPFTNRSGLPEDEVFADGMMEDVIDVLSSFPHWRVLGSAVTANLRTGGDTDLAAIGRQYDVTYVLDGNVRRKGEDLRVKVPRPPHPRGHWLDPAVLKHLT